VGHRPPDRHSGEFGRNKVQFVQFDEKVGHAFSCRNDRGTTVPAVPAMTTDFDGERGRIDLSFRGNVPTMLFIVIPGRILLKELFPARSIHSILIVDVIRSLTHPGA
jgi:hypothetical protein